MGSRVLLRRDSTVLRKSYLKDGVHTRARAMFDDTAGGPSMLMRGQYDPSLEINYVDDPRLAVGEVFTRATLRTVRDFEGRTLVLNSGEVGFWGMRRVENLFATTSEDFSNAAWTKTGVTILGTGNATWAAGGGKKLSQAVTLVTGRRYVVAFKVRSKFGADQPFRLVGDQGATFSADFVAGYNDGEFELQFTATGTAGVLGVASDSTNAAANLQVTWGQLEDTTGRSNLAHSEYVSRGVLVAPYHGANVDGVRYMVTQPNGTLIPRYIGDTIKYYQQLGVVGGNATTPSSAAANITGDVDIRVSLAPATWNPATSIAPVNKHNGAGGYELNIIGSGVLRLWFGDGVQHSATSTAGVPFVAGTMGWVRVTRSAGTGNVTFYYRYLDTDAWTQLGAVVATTASNLALNATAVTVGSSSGGVYANFILYRAQIYAGAALAVDFNPNDASAAGAASLVSSTTGETWTINGNGVSSRVSTWTKPARCGLLRERASTNGAATASDFRSAGEGNATAFWTTTTGTTIATNSITAPDGTLTMQKLQEDATTGPHMRDVSVAISANATFTDSVYVRAGEQGFMFFSLYNGANSVVGYVNLLTGAVTNTAISGTATLASATTEQVQPGVYRLVVTANIGSALTAASVQFRVASAAGTNSYAGTAGVGIYLWGHQFEQLDHATSFIPTTTVAVTRNKDAVTLALDATKWFNAAEGTIAVEGFPNYIAAAISESVDLSDGTSNNSMRLSRSTAACVWGVVNGGGVQASIANGNWITTAQKRAAGAYKANDFQQAFDGVLGTQDTAGTVPTVTTLTIGDRGAGGFEWDGCLGRIHYFPQRMPDSRLASLPAGSV
jgi:hypothetical protein